MADLRGFFDPNAEANSGIEVLPEGVYTVKVTSGDWKETKSGNGRYLQMNMAIVDGPHQGSVIIDRFNLDNPSREAVKIAQGQLKALADAIGVRDPKDTTDLMNVRFQLLLKCEKRSDDPSKMANRVQRYIEKGQTATTPRQNQSDPPWERNALKRGAAPNKNNDAADEIPF